MAIWEATSGRRRGSEGGASSLVRWHHNQGRADITLWLEAGDLGQDPNPAAELLPLLYSFWQHKQDIPQHVQARMRTGGQVIRPGQPYFARRITHGEVPGPQVSHMEFDWSAVQTQREQVAGSVVVTKGARAWLFAPGRGSAQWQQTGGNLRRSQPRLWKHEGYLIEAARLAILDREDDWLDRWARSWRLHREWEADGNRTLAWEISSQLVGFGISSLVFQHALTADPTFEAVVPFGAQIRTGALLALYEVRGAQEDVGWNSLGSLHKWAVCVREDQLTSRRRAWLREHGQLWLDISKSDRAVYKSGWWNTGDRVLSRTKLKLSIWLRSDTASSPANLAAIWPSPPRRNG